MKRQLWFADTAQKYIQSTIVCIHLSRGGQAYELSLIQFENTGKGEQQRKWR